MKHTVQTIKKAIDTEAEVEAFEKELREALKEHHGCKRSQCAEKNRIMEILGSKEFLGDSE